MTGMAGWSSPEYPRHDPEGFPSSGGCGLFYIQLLVCRKTKAKSEEMPIAPIRIRSESQETAGSGTIAGVGVPGVMVVFPNGVRAHFGQGSEGVLIEVLKAWVMFCLNDTMRFHLSPGSTDMRKGLNPLIGVVKDQMGSDVRNGDVFIFIVHIPEYTRSVSEPISNDDCMLN